MSGLFVFNCFKYEPYHIEWNVDFLAFKGVGIMGEELQNPTESQIEERIENTIQEIVERPLEEELEQEVENLVEEPIEEPTEEPLEESIEEPTDKPIKKHNKILIGTIVIVCTLMVVYFGITVYFTNHFYFGSEINGINISLKSIEDVEVLMASELKAYTLHLKEREGKSEQIKPQDVGLSYQSEEVFKQLKESQNPFAWILAYLNTSDLKMTAEMTYDEQLLKDRINQLSCFESSYIIEPKNPSFQYRDNHYSIVDEVLGNKLDRDLLYSHIADALQINEIEIDLEALGCYIAPQYHSTSQKVIEAQDTLNKYAASKITYIFGECKEVLEGATISSWLTVDDHFEVIVDQMQVEAYIDLLSKKHHQVGRVRNFLSSSGQTIQVGGGDFIRPINKAVETQNLISAIKKGQTLSKEPIYGQTAFAYGNSDIGNTYVEIDLKNQHIWFYKNGSLIVEGDIVTGNVRSGHTTPKGVYRLKYKMKNVVLRGPGYAAPVSFWMPFNRGIGIHDASWRSVFGGEIYKTNGSHGCINCPQKIAETIYNHIEADTPVICY